MKKDSRNGCQESPQIGGRVWRQSSRDHEDRRKMEGKVRGGRRGRDSGNQVSVFQGGGRVPQAQTPPHTPGVKEDDSDSNLGFGT